MKKVSLCLTALCLVATSISSYAHDSNQGVVMLTAYPGSGSNNGVVQAQYNPWRKQPSRTWNYPGQQAASRPAPQVQVLPAVQPRQAYPVHPLHTRQVEYRDYLHRYGVGYGNGMPWWSDPVAVPYGPWARGWPNGIW